MQTEPFLTLVEASEALGVPVHALRKAASSGAIPTYKVFSSKQRVLLSELKAIVTGHIPPKPRIRVAAGSVHTITG